MDFEYSIGPFLMYHNTLVKLRSCKGNINIFDADTKYKPSSCQLYPDEVINLDEKRFSGLAVGHRHEFRFVFLQTDNWRISATGSESHILNIWDSNFTPVQYRGLNYNQYYESTPLLYCQQFQIETYDQSTRQRTYRDGDCINSKGEDMSENADWTGNFQITYYFR